MPGEQASFLDASLNIARDFFERQAAGGLSLIRMRDSVDDVIAVQGNSVELRLEVDLAQSLASSEVWFYVGETRIGRAKIDASRHARCFFVPEERGCFPLRYSVVSKGGKHVDDARTRHGILLQVLNDKPVVCVDASLIHERKGKVDVLLKTLNQQGFDLVYIDFGEDDRLEELRHLREQRELPVGAIISLSARIRKFESFEVDFKQSFMGLAINRLRAEGAPVIALITSMKPNQSFPDVELLRAKDILNDEQLELLKKHAQQFVKKREKHSASGEHDIEWRMSQMMTSHWTDNNFCTIELNNRNARLEIFKAIDEAASCIDLQFYIFKESRFTQELGVKLTRAAKRGVEVRLLVDALWSGENFLGSWNSFLKKMGKSSHIHILAADSVKLSDDWDAMSIRQRDHRKLIIIDRQLAFVGGRNAADEYYYDWSEVPIADWTPAENIPWLDAHVRIEGSLVKDIQALFEATWNRNKGLKTPSIKRKNSKAQINKLAKSRACLVVHEGTSDANGLAAYEAMINGAKKKLILVNDFPVLDEIAQMLVQAVHRGVKVSFLTGSVLARRADGSFFEGGYHRELFEYVVKSRLGMLADAGVAVYEFQTKAQENFAITGEYIHPYVHAKLVSADGRYASIGSANLDITASYWEREANVFIDDASLVASLDKKLNAMIKTAVRLDTSSDRWKKEATQREIVARLWPDSFLT